MVVLIIYELIGFLFIFNIKNLPSPEWTRAALSELNHNSSIAEGASHFPSLQTKRGRGGVVIVIKFYWYIITV